MKKIVLFITLLFIPFFIYADMGAPMIESYEAIVTNKDGAKFYEYDSKKSDYVTTGKVLKYNTKVTVLWEEDYLLSIEGYDDYISPKDITPTKDYKLDSSNLGESEASIILRDVEIKTGPSEGYKSTGKVIKKGETITIRPVEVEEQNPWYYVTYDGVSGYINSYGGNFTVSDLGVSEFISVDNIELLDPITRKVLTTIPTSTKIKTRVYSLDTWSRKYYIEYNGVKGLVSVFDVIFKGKPVDFTLKSKMKLYEGVNERRVYDKKLKTVGSLDKGTVVTSEYYETYQICQIYYEKDGKIGWLAEEQNEDGDFPSLKYELPDEEEEEPIIDEKTENDVELIVPVTNNEEKTKANSYHTIYLCIAAGIIACLTTIVVMSLINKKRGK